MQLFHSHHHFKKHRVVHKELRLFEFSVWLHTFSRAMIAIFIPIFLLKIGHGVKEVMIFYFLYNFFDVPLNFVARYFTRKIGARIVIIVGSIFSIAFFIALYGISAGNWPLLIFTAFLMAAYDAFYWVAHLYFFIRCSDDDENLSEETGSLYIVRQVGGMVAPVVGAVILLLFNRNILILVSILILTISIWPLFKIKKIDDKPRRTQKKFFDFFKSKEDIKDYIASAFYGLHGSAESVMWPIFIFLLFDNIESVAILPVIISLTTIVFTYFVSKVARKKRQKTISIASVFIALIWILRIVTENNIFYYISVFLIGLFSVFVSIPLDSNLFEKGEKKDTLSASTYRNAIIMLFKMFFYGALIFSVEVFDISFLIAFSSMVLLAISNYFLRDGKMHPVNIK